MVASRGRLPGCSAERNLESSLSVDLSCPDSRDRNWSRPSVQQDSFPEVSQMCCCSQVSTEPLSDFLKLFVAPVIVACLSYVAVSKLGDWKKNRLYSRLGVSIMDLLLEEVRTGIGILQDLSNNIFKCETLPTACWTGVTTISDDLLVRILALDKHAKQATFHSSNIRIECKNYFEHMTKNVNSDLGLLAKRTLTMAQIKAKYLTEGDKNPSYIFCAREVVKMIEETKMLLDKNSRSLFAK